jgi:hypothetical protein
MFNKNYPSLLFDKHTLHDCDKVCIPDHDVSHSGHDPILFRICDGCNVFKIVAISLDHNGVG